MSDLEHARLMLEMAARDLASLEGMLRGSQTEREYFADSIFGFHAQQAVEKSLKSWLSFYGIAYGKVHDLMSLLQRLDEAGADVRDLYDLIDLNPFAVQFRYDVQPEVDEPINRPGILHQVRKAFERVAAVVREREIKK